MLEETKSLSECLGAFTLGTLIKGKPVRHHAEEAYVYWINSYNEALLDSNLNKIFELQEAGEIGHIARHICGIGINWNLSVAMAVEFFRSKQPSLQAYLGIGG